MRNYINLGFVMLSRKPLTAVTSCPRPLHFPACFVHSLLMFVCFQRVGGACEPVRGLGPQHPPAGLQVFSHRSSAFQTMSAKLRRHTEFRLWVGAEQKGGVLLFLSKQEQKRLS